MRKKLHIVVAILCLSYQLHAGNNNGQALIDSLKFFVNRELNLALPKGFYTEWETGVDSMYSFLYATHKDSSVNVGFTQYYDNYDSALANQKALNTQGYYTLIYRTAGTSKAALSNKLLSYAPEAIAFIFFHELAHHLIRNTTYTFDYDYEEALCDVFANRCCAQFAAINHLLDSSNVKAQQIAFEDIYRFTNQVRPALDTLPPGGKQQVFKQTHNFVKSATTEANSFVRERMLFDVNSAYFLRLKPYAVNYFEVQRMFNYETDLHRVIEKLTPLRHHVLDTYTDGKIHSTPQYYTPSPAPEKPGNEGLQLPTPGYWQTPGLGPK